MFRSRNALSWESTSLLETSESWAEQVEGLVLASSTEAREIVHRALAESLGCLPLALWQDLEPKTVLVAVSNQLSDGEKIELEKSIRFSTGWNVSSLPFSVEVLKQAICQAYCSEEKEISQAADDLRSLGDHTLNKGEYNSPKLDDSDVVSRFLSKLLIHAVARQASDIHITPTRIGGQLSLRIHSNLLRHEDNLCSPDVLVRLVNKIKVLSALNISKRDIVQEGEFAFEVNHEVRRWRVSILPVLYGERIVLRLVSPSHIYRLSALGFPASALDIVYSALEDFGLWVVSGSTGSGKTTTLYSLALHFARQGFKVISIEDSIEGEFDEIAQVKLNESGGLGLKAALKGILRQDPDLLVVGEIRDAEAARLVFEASLTGHRVLTTVHARDVAGTILRLRDVGVAIESLGTMKLVFLSQLLVSRICPVCSKSKRDIETLKCQLCGGSGSHGVCVLPEIWVGEGTRLGEVVFDGDPDCLRRSGSGEYWGREESLAESVLQGLLTEEQMKKLRRF